MDAHGPARRPDKPTTSGFKSKKRKHHVWACTTAPVQVAQGSVQDLVGLCVVLGLGRARSRVVPAFLGRPFRLAAVVNPGLQVVQQIVEIVDVRQAELEHCFVFLRLLGHGVGNHGGTNFLGLFRLLLGLFQGLGGIFHGLLLLSQGGFCSACFGRVQPGPFAFFVCELPLQTLQLGFKVWAKRAFVGQIVEHLLQGLGFFFDRLLVLLGFLFVLVFGSRLLASDSCCVEGGRGSLAGTIRRAWWCWLLGRELLRPGLLA